MSSSSSAEVLLKFGGTLSDWEAQKMRVSWNSITKQMVITFDREVELKGLKNESCLKSDNKANCYNF